MLGREDPVHVRGRVVATHVLRLDQCNTFHALFHTYSPCRSPLLTRVISTLSTSSSSSLSPRAATVLPLPFLFYSNVAPLHVRPFKDFSFADDTEKLYLLSCLLAYMYPMSMLENHVMSEVARMDTTSISLSVFLWELTRRRDILPKLRNEIDPVMTDASLM
ncbi:hypothetical protein C8F01DRAFT_1238734 [Mycena amicta]|nr:hypothetical protein C8F01DRAFT_1238734 [Mycena amicta]